MTAAALPLPVAAQAPPWTTVFNRPAFLALSLGPGGQPVTLEHHEDGRHVGTLAGVLEDGVLTCGHSAPFGGIDFARPRETAGRVASALDATLEAARGAGAHTVRVRCRPAPFGENEGLITYGLLNRGFRVEAAEIASVIELDRTPSPEAYLAALRSPARRALGHLEAMGGWAFAEIGACDDRGWREAHALLRENRAAKDRVLSLSEDYILRARDALPGSLRAFVLARDGAACAAALVWVTAPGCWYVYAWGDARHELDRSPMNLLALRLVEAALAGGVRMIDLGSSSAPAAAPGEPLVPDEGLLRFKTSVLARTHPRLVLAR